METRSSIEISKVCTELDLRMDMLIVPAANILLAANGQVKLADFGVSGQLSATMTKKNTLWALFGWHQRSSNNLDTTIKPIYGLLESLLLS